MDTLLKEQQESLNTTDKQASGIKAIEKTPFTIITENGNSFGVMGKYRLTENFKTEKEAEKEVNKICWDRLIQVISIMIQEQESIKQLNQN